ASVLGAAGPAAAAPRHQPHAPAPKVSVPGKDIAAAAVAPGQSSTAALAGTPKVTWPAGVVKSADPGVRVEVLDRAAAAKAGVDGLLLHARRTDMSTQDTKATTLTVDYSGFRYAYGGDWAARLRLVQLDGKGGR